MHPGDPTPRSPDEVMTAIPKTWKLIMSELCASQRIRMIVFHYGTETYWETMYSPARYTDSATWKQVKPYTRTITDYKEV